MHFKRLEIQGFKTFASRAVFVFEPGVTAVVGSNGVGKSNVSDAVRWVLGEQSYSALRCKRTEELLFSGGKGRPPAGLAEVSLTLDNSDRLLPLDFDEVTFTRRATRAGDNEYFINRARVRLRDVVQAAEPLGGAYTIINQGLVDAALTLRPEERRRLFEDAAEIGGYEVRRAESERRLRETAGNLQRASDLLVELEPRLRSLRRQAGQARQHRELSAELRVLLEASYARQSAEGRAALAEAMALAEASEAALAAARANQESGDAALAALRAATRGLRERIGQLQRDEAALRGQAEAARQELALSDDRLAAIRRLAAEHEGALANLAAQEQDAEQALAGAKEALAQHEIQAAALRVSAGEQELALASGDLARRDLARQVAQAQDAALKAAGHLAGQRSRAEQLAQQRERLLREQAGQHATLQAAEQRLAQARAALAETQVAEAQSAEDLRVARQAEEQARAEQDSLRGERQGAEERLAAVRRTLADTEARAESLERLARAYTGNFAGVRAAMQWAERVGRGFALVSAILQVPPNIETAVEVALGSRLQNIVVDRWQDAEDAIADLRRSGAGRATFMPLDTLRRSGEERRDPGDGVLGVAADLIAYDERYRAVAWQLLGRVLIVSDLPTARREVQRLQGGWNIVTLAGEQVSGGGAVTGGAQVKEAGTLRRERELRELPALLEQARAAVAAASEVRRALDARLDAARRAAEGAEVLRRERARAADARRAALDGAQRAAARAEQELGWQRTRSEAAARDLEALAALDLSLGAALSQAEQAAEGAEAHLAAQREHQDRLAAADSAAQRELAAARAALARADAQRAAALARTNDQQQALGRLASQRGDAARRLEDLSGESVALAERQRVAAEHAADFAARSAVIRQQAAPTEVYLVAHEADLVAHEAGQAAATATLLDAEATHSRATLVLQRTNDRLAALRERAEADGVALDAAPPAEELPAEELQPRIQNLRTRIERLGSVNPLALEEYEQAAERHTFLTTQIADIQQAEQALRELIAELERSVEQRFIATFQSVAEEFAQSFQQLFGGGSAELQLVKASDGQPEGGRSIGIEILARPPGKRMQNLSLLSGGERTLTAIALLTALLKVNPTPFCILDEVDAALDESNVGRFRDALQGLAQQTQFIVITHNRGTIEAADTLYGISMGDDGGSRVLSLRLGKTERSSEF